ncbi:MAG: c-type cytochrome [Phycisphaerae bacterium]|nr:c-type cytochrome [Phycisphaerae bacterium]
MRRLKYVALLGLAIAIGGTACPFDGVTPVDQFEVVRAALDAYFGSDPAPAATIAAADVFDMLNDGDASTTPYVLSVRSAADYATGHVPGAANVPWKTVADAGALADLPTDDTQVVVYCYTGHTGAVATTVLNALGYNAVNMKWGIMSWTRDAAVRVAQAFDDTTDSHTYATETTDNPGSATNDLPTLDVTTSTDTTEIVRAAAEAYLGSDPAPTITAQDLFDKINDGDDTTTPFIISVRAPEHYALGHIPGAINIPWKTIAQEDNLKKIPADKDIVVYCYTGHTGGLATTALNLLGYHAKNLKWGIMSWTQDATVRVAAPFNDATDSHDYATEAGTGGGGEDGAALFATNCAACHGADGSGPPDVTGSTAAEIQAKIDAGGVHAGAAGLTAAEVAAIEAFLGS